MAGIFLKQGDALVPMREAPYTAEAVLQTLVASHPELLTGDDSNGRLLLIRREAAVKEAADGQARWALDHLFLDAEGVPVLVEVKRSTDSRIRREVVGQMLDYAAGTVHWTVDQVRGWLTERCARDGADVNELLAAHADDVDVFWEQIATNIAARRLRLVFVADAIPPELATVVEFLNEQMTACAVLAVEVRQYLDPDGAQTIAVPTVIGQTQHARAVKSKRAAPLAWDLDSVLDAASELAGARESAVIRAVAEWAAAQPDLSVAFGRAGTRKWASLRVLLNSAPKVSPFIFWANGSVELTFEYMISSTWRPFDEEGPRRELQRRLNAMPEVEVPTERLALRPNIPLAFIATRLPEFLDIVDWTFQQARNENR